MTRRIPPRLILAALGLIAVTGCGDGSVGSGGTGALPLAVASGTVNGFGSVVVDGKAYDDSAVPTLRETAPSVYTQTAAQLGSHLVVDTGNSGAVASIEVVPLVSGAIGQLTPSGLVVLGQTIVVNADSSRGPVTQFGGGYVGAASLRVGDPVDVHGVVVRQGSGYVLQATRVDRLTALPAYVRVTGIVGGASSTGFTLGALAVASAAATVLPAGRSIGNGETVAVLAAASAATVDTSGQARLAPAAQVRVQETGTAGDAIVVGGTIAALDAANARFSLGSIVVAYASSRVAPSTGALGNGRYVRVQGTVAADGSVQATDVTVLDGSVEPEAELAGTIVGYVAASRTFTVRGVSVDAGAATLRSCPSGGLTSGLYASIDGTLSPTGVVATVVTCEGEPSGATVERSGTASAVDMASMTFVLTTSSNSTLTVRWTSSTYFAHTSPATLAGSHVEIEGRIDATGALVAQQVELDD